MSAIDQRRPPMSDGGIGLADEISDVIEEHGRGLDAGAISSTIEAVLDECEDQESESSVSNAALERELTRFVEDHAAGLKRAEILELLRDIADDLQSGSLEPEVVLEQRDDVRIVGLRFDCAFALDRALPKLFDIRGYFVEADLALTYLDEMRLRIHATPIEETVELQGCVTRSAPNGFTVQIWQPSVEIEQTLRGLPDQMRAARV